MFPDLIEPNRRTIAIEAQTTRVFLSMSNKDVFDVLNGSVEPVLAITDSDTPDTPTNLVGIQRGKRAF